jgi:hypothetical protein
MELSLAFFRKLCAVAAHESGMPEHDHALGHFGWQRR